MKVSVEHLAQLARLSLSEEEKRRFSAQLDGILEYVGRLNELDTSAVEPTSHVLSINTVVREDIPGDSLPLEEALRNAPDRSDAFYRVPRIIE
jgi:aspartyl-tRNA(Asn)/glutamyl-tRNA(Gln) amidotransferase subunit C